MTIHCVKSFLVYFLSTSGCPKSVMAHIKLRVETFSYLAKPFGQRIENSTFVALYYMR